MLEDWKLGGPLYSVKPNWARKTLTVMWSVLLIPITLTAFLVAEGIGVMSRVKTEWWRDFVVFFWRPAWMGADRPGETTE